MAYKFALAALVAAVPVVSSPASAATIILNGDGFRIPPASDATGPGESSRTVATTGTNLGRITSIVLTLTNLRHTEVGDLQFLLSHRGTEVNFGNFFGARKDLDTDEADLNGTYRIFDAASTVFQNAPGDPIPSGDYRPNNNNLFANFNGLAAAGNYTLTVRDRLATDSGRLGSFQLQITTDAMTAAVPEPATWAMMIGGFGMVGGSIRAARRKQKVSVSHA